MLLLLVSFLLPCYCMQGGTDALMSYSVTGPSSSSSGRDSPSPADQEELQGTAEETNAHERGRLKKIEELSKTLHALNVGSGVDKGRMVPFAQLQYEDLLDEFSPQLLVDINGVDNPLDYFISMSLENQQALQRIIKQREAIERLATSSEDSLRKQELMLQLKNSNLEKFLKMQTAHGVSSQAFGGAVFDPSAASSSRGFGLSSSQVKEQTNPLSRAMSAFQRRTKKMGELLAQLEEKNRKKEEELMRAQTGSPSQLTAKEMLEAFRRQLAEENMRKAARPALKTTFYPVGSSSAAAPPRPTYAALPSRPPSRTSVNSGRHPINSRIMREVEAKREKPGNALDLGVGSGVGRRKSA